MSKSNQQLIEEYLKNGGKITKCPPSPVPEPDVTFKASNAGPVKIMSLSEGELYYSEPSKRKKKKVKIGEGINFDVLPDHIKKLCGK